MALGLIAVGLILGFSLRLALGGLAAAVMACLTIFFLVPSIASDELELELAMKRLGGGEMPDKVRIVAIGELADIKHAFNEMAQHVGERLKTLTAERNRLEQMLGSVSDAVFMVDRHGDITHVNEAAAGMFNLGEKPLGRSFIEVMRDHEFDALLKKVWQPAAGRKERSNFGRHAGFTG